jgi:putative ABC transport system permease protein
VRIWRVLWRARQLDADMHEEMRFHVLMEAERLTRVEGLDPEEARRLAYVRFGGVEKFKEEGREARGLYWLGGALLDARIGVRMLVKHRWLTLVGGIAMAVAIAIGAIAFEAIGALLDPALPFPDGQRVVALKYVATKAGRTDDRVLHAFAAWRNHVTTLEHVGAFRNVQHNLAPPNAAPEPIDVAEITASAFDIAQTPPMLGRYLRPSDEQAGAAPVVVIGYDAWRVRFNADPEIVGHRVQLGGALHTIVGVMPAGFLFPFDDQFWMPLRLDPLKYAAWRGPALHLFARLKQGVTIEQAEAELASTGQSVADVHPDGRDYVHPVVLPFTREHAELTPTTVWLLRAAQLLVGALSFVVAGNLAILLYARTVSRLGEIAVRTALGASRGRLLFQLFIEALLLTLLGAIAGLVLAGFALQQIQVMSHTGTGGFPFWVHYELSVTSVLYGVALAVVAAAIMGVLPGLKATGTRLSANLQELNGRTATGLGSLWTTLIVAQVAVAAAVLPAAAYISWHVVQTQLVPPTIAVEQFVVANMNLSDQAAADREQVRNRLLALMARLREEPGVAAVTFSSAVPGFGPDRRIEFPDTAPQRDGRTPEVATFQIDVGFLKTYGARILAGRDFDARDVASFSTVIVNRTFASDVLGVPAHAALGSRFRDVTRPDWVEVVGVVDDFPGFPRDPGSETEPTVYEPAAPGDFHPAVVSMRFSGPIPDGTSQRVREAGARVDPALQLRRVVLLSNFYDELRSAWRMVGWAVGIITIAVLLLSAAGMHALMSFTIAQRTREIGIRSALGAPPRQLLTDLFGRAMRQLSIGLLVGSLASVGVFAAAGIGVRPAAAMLLTVAAVMALVASFAALGPARRSLRLPVVEALRVEA